MMQGFVNQSCEAIIRVAVGHANSPKQMVDAVIDTGFTGFLSLPLATITRLGLPWHFRDIGTLGDGSAVRDVPLNKVPGVLIAVGCITLRRGSANAKQCTTGKVGNWYLIFLRVPNL